MERRLVEERGMEEEARQEMVPGRRSFRGWLLSFAVAATIFSVLHHADHVIRGNHSG